MLTEQFIDLRSDTCTQPTAEMREAMARAPGGDYVQRDAPRGKQPEAPVATAVKVLCLENTHNGGGGKIWSLDQIQEVTDVARERGVKTHLDGARLWNASVATGISEKSYARYFDSISVCFSKGLGAPVGSALCGTRAYIKLARRFKQQF